MRGGRARWNEVGVGKPSARIDAHLRVEAEGFVNFLALASLHKDTVAALTHRLR